MPTSRTSISAYVFLVACASPVETVPCDFSGTWRISFPGAPAECGGNNPRTVVFMDTPTLESLRYRDEVACDGVIETDTEACEFSWLLTCDLDFEEGTTVRSGIAAFNGFAFVGEEHIEFEGLTGSCERTHEIRMTRWYPASD